MTNEIAALIANIALALSFIVGLIFGIAQVKAAARDRRERLSLDALRNFQTHEFAQLMQFVMSHDMPATRGELDALPVDEQVMFVEFAQQMESLGILVAEKYLSLDLVDKTLGSFVSTSWQKYQAMVMHIRKTESEPFMAEYFQWLAERIAQRMRDTPRKAFYETD
jgi:hypothetical protein